MSYVTLMLNKTSDVTKSSDEASITVFEITVY